MTDSDRISALVAQLELDVAELRWTQAELLALTVGKFAPSIVDRVAGVFELSSMPRLRRLLTPNFNARPHR